MIYLSKYRIGDDVMFVFPSGCRCRQKIEAIHIDNEGVKFSGTTLEGFSAGSRWGLSELEISQLTKITLRYHIKVFIENLIRFGFPRIFRV